MHTFQLKYRTIQISNNTIEQYKAYKESFGKISELESGRMYRKTLSSLAVDNNMHPNAWWQVAKQFLTKPEAIYQMFEHFAS